MRIIGIAVITLLTAAPLAGNAAGTTDWLKVDYRCENGQTMQVEYRENGSAVRVAMGDQSAVKMIARPAREGFRYGGSIYELRGDRNHLSWQAGNKTPVKCLGAEPQVATFAAIAEQAR